MQKEFIEILDRYLKGDATESEIKLVEEWYAAIENQPEQSLSAEEKLSVKINLQTRMANYTRDHERVDHKVVPIHSKNKIWLAAAAAVLILVTAFIFMYNPFLVKELGLINPLSQTLLKEIENKNTAEQIITLADGSQVALKNGSQLKFPETFQGATREVFLEGEAFFEVAHNPSRPFIVYANGVVTKVLGTSFTIKAYHTDKQVTVSVRTGKVSVYKQSQNSTGGTQIILTPNQQAVYDKAADQVSRTLVQEPKIILPANELIKMRFEDAPITEIFDALEKAYGVDILYDEKILSNCSLTTSLLDETLYARLNIICKAIGAVYTVEDTQIVIESSGCQ